MTDNSSKTDSYSNWLTVKSGIYNLVLHLVPIASAPAECHETSNPGEIRDLWPNFLSPNLCHTPAGTSKDSGWLTIRSQTHNVTFFINLSLYSTFLFKPVGSQTDSRRGHREVSHFSTLKSIFGLLLTFVETQTEPFVPETVGTLTNTCQGQESMTSDTSH